MVNSGEVRKAQKAFPNKQLSTQAKMAGNQIIP